MNRSSIKLQIGGDNIVEVLLTEDDEEIQTLKFYRFYPSLNECVLIWRLRSRLLHPTTDVLENLIEFLDVHAITITSEILHFEVRFAGLLGECMSLTDHPLGVRLEDTGRAEDSSRADMDKCQHKCLPQPSRRPNHLAKEIGLPQSIDVDLEEVVPCTRAKLRTRFDSLSEVRRQF